MNRKSSTQGFVWLPLLIAVAVIIIIAIVLYLWLKGAHGRADLARYRPGAAAKVAKRPQPRRVAVPNGNLGFELSGLAGKRHILKKVLPAYPDWAEEQGVFGTIQIGFTVTPEGDVASTLQVFHTTGNQKLDNVALDALKQWKFAPETSAALSNAPGTITFAFRLGS